MNSPPVSVGSLRGTRQGYGVVLGPVVHWRHGRDAARVATREAAARRTARRRGGRARESARADRAGGVAARQGPPRRLSGAAAPRHAAASIRPAPALTGRA